MPSNLLWSEGRSILVISVIVLIIFVLFSFLAKKKKWQTWHYITTLVAYGILLFICASFYFFRNPDRRCPEALHDTNILVCPADGHVVEIVQGDNVGDGFNTRVSIFLSPFDVHVNWVPMAGIITSVTHSPGRFIAAFVPKSSDLNERLDIRLRAEESGALDLQAQVGIIRDEQVPTKACVSKEILVRQIAGTLARRIVVWVNQGERVTLGQKYGMIKFGSRVDIFLPKTVQIAVHLNQKVYGGQTSLGRWTCS